MVSYTQKNVLLLDLLQSQKSYFSPPSFVFCTHSLPPWLACLGSFLLLTDAIGYKDPASLGQRKQDSI